VLASDLFRFGSQMLIAKREVPIDYFDLGMLPSAMATRRPPQGALPHSRTVRRKIDMPEKKSRSSFRFQNPWGKRSEQVARSARCADPVDPRCLDLPAVDRGLLIRFGGLSKVGEEVGPVCEKPAFEAFVQ
jgi:hypothetical protein